jgi:acyl-CoA synthetase (NDP forming)
VELLEDVAVSLAPVDKVRANQMLRKLKGYPLLNGFRGAAPANVDVLADMLCRLSELGVDLSDEIAEIDVNPVIVDAQGGIAVDALVVRSAGAPAGVQ